ncbi:MAG: aldo/keto reductase [Firmicutes bacterium]|nr:aldo/keto reductase [Bacillota bacterium]
MIYSDFHGLKLSRLGFGCMRFATDPVTGAIDQEKVNAMFKAAIAGGVNYFDTAYPYLGGNSEIAMARALKDYPRESYFLADKFPGHSLVAPVDNIQLFHRSLEKCGTDYFDFYLLHNISEYSIKTYEDPTYHIIPDILKMKEEGKIRHLGFSFHGGISLLKDVLRRYEGVFEFVQIQCNYLDWTLQKAKEAYEIITEAGLGVWVMESVRGGKLANLPEKASSMLKAFDPAASDASYGFRFLQDLPNVIVMLSGMNEVSQVEDNLKTFETHKPLSEAERATLFEIAELLKQGVPCTACRYCCDGCPMELDIPFLLDCYNSCKTGSGLIPIMRLEGLPEEKRPAACIQCGQCAHACPQHIDVPATLTELAEIFASGAKWSQTAQARDDEMRKDLGTNA